VDAIKLLRTALFALCAYAVTAIAQQYPTKPVRMIVPYPPGASSVDVVGRITAARLSEEFGQSVVVENRPGANGMLGSEQVARAAPDGYTFLFGTASTHVTGIFVSKDVPYDPVRDFTPITQAGTAVSVFIVPESSTARTVKELLESAKRSPGRMSYASNGVGSINHLAGEQLKLLAGIDLVHVPYKGLAQIFPDLISGQVSLTFGSLIAVLPHIKSGKVRAIAVLDSSRIAELPDIPTLNETLPEFWNPPGWIGFFAPAKLPAALLARLHGGLAKCLNNAEVAAKLKAAGFTVIANTPEQFASAMKSEIEQTARIVKAAGIKPE
jgi:tripartite-type tricarboxylate transporter receptor subunit TctC